MKKRIDLPQVSDVTLPEVFHLRAGVWILIILAVLIIALFFITSVLPGIIKGGRYVTFKAPLSESGIILDGTYLGPADHQYFISHGQHTIATVASGIEYDRRTITIDHPILFTLFLHRTRTITIPHPTLSVEQKQAIIRFDLEEIQTSSAILEWTMVDRYAPLFQNLKRDLATLSLSEGESEDAIHLALSFITSKAMLEDAKSAFSDHRSELVQASLRAAEQAVLGTPKAATPPKEEQRPLPIKAADLDADGLTIEGFAYPGQQIVMGTTLDPSYPTATEYRTEAYVEPFVLATLPTTLTQWAQFIEENPMWAKTNKQHLQDENLVDEAYLAGLAPSTVFVTTRAVTNVSYHAALAFCSWLSQKSGKTVFLPTEAMLTVAIRHQSNTPYHGSLSALSSTGSAPSMLLGGVWEITQSPFVPLARLMGYDKILDLHHQWGLSVNPIVKGGSYLNNSAAITSETVGTIPPYACGDQIGFRIAWYE